MSDGYAERVEILRELIRGMEDPTVDELANVTGWPRVLIEEVITEDNFDFSKNTFLKAI